MQLASSSPPVTSDGSTPEAGEGPQRADRFRAYCTQQASPDPLSAIQALQHAYDFGSNDAAADQRSRALDDLLAYALIGLGAMTLLSGLLGWIMAGRVLRPVASITQAARRASERHLGERLALRGAKDEFTKLADAFDEMLERLDTSFAGQRRFVANASHELRTPLTVMRTAIDVTLAKPNRTPEQLDTMAVQVREAVDQAEALVSALLTLARSDHAVIVPEQTDLATAAEDALDLVTARVRAAKLTLHTALEPAPVSGDIVLLERAVANLVDNAVLHNHPGGTLQIRTGTHAGRAFLEIQNTGPSIPEELVPRLFERFRRLHERTDSPSGFGIGLSIVTSVLTAHQGTVTARSRAGGGLVVRIELAAADPAAPPSPAAGQHL